MLILWRKRSNVVLSTGWNRLFFTLVCGWKGAFLFNDICFGTHKQKGEKRESRKQNCIMENHKNNLKQ